MAPNSIYRSMLVILMSALSHAVILLFVLGLPTSDFFADHEDMENSQIGRPHPTKVATLPAAQPDPTPVAAIQKDDVATPAPAPVKHKKKSKIHTPDPEAQASDEATPIAEPYTPPNPEPATEPEVTDAESTPQTKVVDVKVEKDGKETSVDDSEDKVNDAAVQDAAPGSKPNAEPTAEVDKPKPIKERVGGVEAVESGDEKTEASSAELTPPNPTADADANSAKNANIVDSAQDPREK